MKWTMMLGIPSAVIFAAVAFAAEAALPGAGAAERWIQYGALGLCALMIVFNRMDAVRVGKTLDRKDRELMNLAVGFMSSINTISQALKDRPCVIGDSRIEAANVKLPTSEREHR